MSTTRVRRHLTLVPNPPAEGPSSTGSPTGGPAATSADATTSPPGAGVSSPSTPIPLKKGDVILDGYTIRGLLGRGGMSEVWEASAELTGTLAAIKILPAELASSPERRARLMEEVRISAALSHPNIVPTLHAG